MSIEMMSLDDCCHHVFHSMKFCRLSLMAKDWLSLLLNGDDSLLLLLLSCSTVGVTIEEDDGAKGFDLRVFVVVCVISILGLNVVVCSSGDRSGGLVGGFCLMCLVVMLGFLGLVLVLGGGGFGDIGFSGGGDGLKGFLGFWVDSDGLVARDWIWVVGLGS
ncbi:hypothetical protein LWI28_022704 [Acer negundo]|uniref:Transmembrane protein n=1 Tax=Acer negundo TaxID=4023 RepID=A0AAD5NVW7_ACENE|nr:hypothetical protein LWI28_022704 [Acer negundo]